MQNFIIITHIISALAVVCFAYYFAIAVFSLRRTGSVRKPNVDNAESEKLHTFAIVVAAHNEERVIGNLLAGLRNLDYPAELFDIFVAADNCTDATAAIAEKSGAVVLKRYNSEKRGKGYALEYAFEHIFELNEKYNYVAVFDADNEVSPNFLTAMNTEINGGSRVVQGYLDSKNPLSSWVTFSYSLWYWINNSLSQLARRNLGIGCQLGGTGFVIETELLREIGWGADCLAEDTEFTLKLALADIKVGYCHSAVTYDEKPLTMKVSWKQRKRWTQGIADVSERFAVPLLRKGFRERKSEPFHAVLNLLAPTLFTVSIAVLSFKSFLPLVLYMILVLAALYKDKKLTQHILWGSVTFAVYIVTWIPIGIAGWLKRREKEWYHTPHGE